MTAQIEERIIYKGEELHMASEPLQAYLTKINYRFLSQSSACWRGYFGKWEIKDDKLYLIGLRGNILGFKEVDMNHLFPGQKMIFAEWFTGELRIPLGKRLKYVHQSYNSIYEEDLFFQIKEGIIIKSSKISNKP